MTIVDDIQNQQQNTTGLSDDSDDDSEKEGGACADSPPPPAPAVACSQCHKEYPIDQYGAEFKYAMLCNSCYKSRMSQNAGMGFITLFIYFFFN